MTSSTTAIAQRWRRPAGAVGAATVAVLLGIGVAHALGPSNRAAHVPAPGAVPAGFEPVDGAVAKHDKALASIVERTTVAVYRVHEGHLLVIDGSHDALESMLPEGRMRTDAATNALTGSNAGWQYLALRDRDGLAIRRVGMIYAPDLQAFPGPAIGLVRSPNPTRAEASGDISALVSGSDSNTVTYRAPETGDVVAVQTFASERLDPVLAYFAPMSTKVGVDGRTAYAFDSGNGNRVLAASARTGELVVVSTSSPKVTIDELVRVADSALAH